MDKFEKAIKKLSAKEQKQIEELFARLSSGHFKGLDIKKLQGSINIFRVRMGAIRIIYQFKDSKIVLLYIGRRSEKTYKVF